MKVRVDNPALLPDLVSELSRRIDAIVSQTASNELEVSILGSQSRNARLAELNARLQAWGTGATVHNE